MLNKHIQNNRFNLFQTSNAFYIETSCLICTADQMTGFFMKCNTKLEWVKLIKVFDDKDGR